MKVTEDESAEVDFETSARKRKKKKAKLVDLYATVVARLVLCDTILVYKK